MLSSNRTVYLIHVTFSKPLRSRTPCYYSPPFILHTHTPSKLTLPLIHGPPPPRKQNGAPHFLPCKLHVAPLPQRHNINIHKPCSREEVLDALNGKMRHHNRVVHLLLELGRRVVDVVFRFFSLMMMMMMMVLMFMIMFLPLSMSMSLAMPPPMPLPMSMRMHGMIPLGPLHLRAVLIGQQIAALEEVVDDEHAAGPESQLQLARGVHHVLEVVEPEADGRNVEVAELGAGKGGRRRVGLVQEVAVRGGEGGRERGRGHACVVRGYHVGRDVDAARGGDVGAESLQHVSTLHTFHGFLGAHYPGHQSGSRGIVEEPDLCNVAAGARVGERDAEPVEVGAEEIGDLVVDCCEPGFGVIGARYGAAKMSVNKFVWLGWRVCTRNICGLLLLV
jgi:hypothetical protein